jgi:hypothetical protein
LAHTNDDEFVCKKDGFIANDMADEVTSPESVHHP